MSQELLIQFITRCKSEKALQTQISETEQGHALKDNEYIFINIQ